MSIPKFNQQASVFKFNETYSLSQDNEAFLYHEILCEAIWKYGTDVIFVPRELSGVEEIFGEYLAYTLRQGYPYRMFVEEVEQWGGMGDAYAKFGLRVTDQMTCFMPKDSMRVVNPDNSLGDLVYPKHNDLIYHVPSKKLFEITHIEPEATPSFYLFGNMVCWKFSCNLYTYDHSEVIDDASLPPGLLDLSMDTESTDYDRNNAKIKQNVIDEAVIDGTEVDPLFR